LGVNAGEATRSSTTARARDPRLDFFRGSAMLIILVAHIPDNAWILWIPARFGFSDATEIFVFCSGLASAMAFGATFAARGWLIGAARIVHRVWQVYWAHIGVVLSTAAMLVAVDINGWGARPHPYVTEPHVVPLFEDTARALVGLMTLTYVPGLFDILPMYLVILGMIPVVMALHRAGGRSAVAAFVLVIWAAAALAGYARVAEGAGQGPWLRDAAIALGARLSGLNLPATPDFAHVWFFNPFSWQLVFFTGFAFGMGWLPAPPVSRRLALAAAVFALACIPFAWHKLYIGVYFAEGALLPQWLWEVRSGTAALHDKTTFGVLRYLHFLAVAYLAWFAVGPGGARLSHGFAPVVLPQAPRRRRALRAAALAALTAPYAWDDILRDAAPGALDAMAGLLPLAPGPQTGVLALVHVAALLAALWNALSDRARAFLLRDAVVAATPVLRRVGTQSLAVFMASIPLSQLCGLALDHSGRTLVTVAVVNLAGMVALIGVAYGVSWIKSHPWRVAPVHRTAAPAATSPGGAL
jgi:hypothetical protein